MNILLMVQKSQGQPPGMYKTLVNNEINYQPQLVFPGFQPSTVGSSRLRFFSWSHWSTLIPHPKLSHSFHVIFSERCRLILATPCHLSALGWDRYWRSGHSLQPGSTDFRVPGPGFDCGRATEYPSKGPPMSSWLRDLELWGTKTAFLHEV